MAKPSRKKGQRQMPIYATQKTENKTDTRLEKYRAKSACMVHKATGDPEKAFEEGIAVYEALAPARARANKTAGE